ncbi:MAG: iron ABC transporter permease [Nitrospinae bacterium]|nr:iron ABC transporter permease [Nitrospinota bacterium]
MGAGAGLNIEAFPRRLAKRFQLDFWTSGTLLLAFFIAAPLLAVSIFSLQPSGDIWHHLLTTVLSRYVMTTMGLMVGVGIGTLLIGTATAWLVTLCRFPGRRIVEWALLLPMAMPTYVVAYVYTDVFEFAGPVQTLSRNIFGWESSRDYWFPEIRSLGGAIFVMTLTLYPYVYLLARVAFVQQSVCILEVSRTLGKTAWQSFISIALPSARPSLVIGVSLVLMEALNDFGTVDFFAVETLTAGIFDVWLNMNNLSGAAQLAVIALCFVLLLLWAERKSRTNQRYFNTSTKYQALPSYQLRGIKMLGAVLTCLLPIGFGFILPSSILGYYAWNYYEESISHDFYSILSNSLVLSSLSATLSVLAGIFLAYGVRLQENPLLKSAARLASVGYAVPGAVLAVGVLIPMGKIDVFIQGFLNNIFGISTGLLFSGTIAAVTYGYLTRFLALSYGTMEASLMRVTPNMDGAARTLGLGPGKTLKRIHLPMLRGGILAAAILVFVDTMKELPMTIILRPFNFETLATQVHQLATDELLEESALGSLSIVAAGLLPVIYLSRTIRGTRPGAGK